MILYCRKQYLRDEFHILSLAYFLFTFIIKNKQGGTSGDIAVVFTILGITIVLFITEIVRIDVAAILAMLALAWTGILTPAEAFSGFSSNAVIAVLSVMIMGRGISDTGVMDSVSGFILKITGDTETKVRAGVSFSVGIMSAFMQNIGATALFLPALSGISRRAKIPVSRLIMPLGFAAIAGGTLTMVASGPVIVLNDLMRQSGLEPFSLFYITPIGILLLITVVLYFIVAGKRILPQSDSSSQRNYQQELVDAWHLPAEIYRFNIPENSPIIGKTREGLRKDCDCDVHIIAMYKDDDIKYAPWRYTKFESDTEIAVLGSNEEIDKFAQTMDLERREKMDKFRSLKNPEHAGFAEVMIPYRSKFVGLTIRDIAMRKNYHVEPIALISENVQSRENFSDIPLKAGNTLIVYGKWNDIDNLENNQNCSVITPYKTKPLKKSKALTAIICFLAAILLAVLGIRLSLALLTGAVSMVVLRVLTMEDAYKAVDWKTVFLLAGLIPLSIAMEKSGAASFIANNIIEVLEGAHMLLILGVLGLITTIFSLFMSNVAATVLLVPLIINLAPMLNADPRILALFIAVMTANSFILPTHQVNAFLLSFGNYSNRDYLKAGSGLTVLFLAAASLIMYIIYL
ncbi:MAG: SLC13 family permease [bacterium]